MLIQLPSLLFQESRKVLRAAFSSIHVKTDFSLSAQTIDLVPKTTVTYFGVLFVRMSLGGPRVASGGEGSTLKSVYATDCSDYAE